MKFHQLHSVTCGTNVNLESTVNEIENGERVISELVVLSTVCWWTSIKNDNQAMVWYGMVIVVVTPTSSLYDQTLFILDKDLRIKIHIAWFRIQPQWIFIWQYWWSLCALCPDRKTLVNTSLSATTFDSTIPRESLRSSWECTPCNPKQSIGKSVHVLYLKYTHYN